MVSVLVSARRFASRRALLLAAGFLVTTALARPAQGQLWLPVGSQLNVNAVTLGSHAAHDKQNSVYLVVGGNGHVTGVFTNLRGEPLTGPIPIKPSDAAFGAFPRVSYSAHLGGFLVVWAEEGGGTVLLKMRTVVYPGTMGPVFTVTDSTAWLAVAGPAVAYSPTSQRFLIAYKTLPPAVVRVQSVGLNGAPVGPSVQVSSGFGRDPGVAWNPYRDEFGVSFSGEGNNGQFFSVFVRVPASNPAGFARTTFNQTPSGMTAVTDIDFNVLTNRYVMVWWEPGQARAAEISDLGVPLTMGTASFVVGAFSYDAMDAVRNPLSGSMLLVGLSGAEDSVGGAELNGNGFRISPDMVISPAGPGQNARYTRVAAHMNSRRWLATFSRNFTSTWSQPVATQTSNGGAPGSHPPVSGPPPPPPPPPPSDSDGDGVPDNLDACPGTPPGTPVNASGCPTQPPPNGGCTGPAPGPGWVCVNGGWLPPGHPGIPSGDSDGDGVPDASDLCPGTPAGTAVDANGCAIPNPPPSGNCTTPAPGPGWVCVNGGWLPPGHPGICTTPQPGPGWICVNGGWLPPQFSPATAPARIYTMPLCSSTTSAPQSGWIRVGDGWVPPSHPSASRGVCKAG